MVDHLKYDASLQLQWHHPIHSRNRLQKIVDVTIGYPNNTPINFLDIMLGKRKECIINVHYRIFDVADISTKDKIQLQNWMNKLYQEKDEFFNKFHFSGKLLNGHFTSKENESIHDIRHIVPIKWKYFLFNMFYFVSLLVFISLLSCILYD